MLELGGINHNSLFFPSSGGLVFREDSGGLMCSLGVGSVTHLATSSWWPAQLGDPQGFHTRLVLWWLSIWLLSVHGDTAQSQGVRLHVL